MNNELLVETIRTLCRENNISTSILEKKLNFGAGLISRWTKSDPSLSKIVDIAEYFHVSLDDVVGYNKSYSENQMMKFLNTLYDKTVSGKLTWYVYDDNHPLQYDDLYIFDKEFADWKHELYYCKYETGYFILRVFYLMINFEITDTSLTLYIQPDSHTHPVLQCEGEDLLGSLWQHLRPKFYGKLDEVKAEELKCSFVANKTELNNESDLIKQLETIKNDPLMSEYMKLIKTDTFKQMQQMFNSPDFLNAINTIAKYSNLENNIANQTTKTPKKKKIVAVYRPKNAQRANSGEKNS